MNRYKKWKKKKTNIQTVDKTQEEAKYKEWTMLGWGIPAREWEKAATLSKYLLQ